MELIRKMKTGVHQTYVECLICGYSAKSLTNHLRHHHRITAHEYKEAFELCYNQPLECEETTEKRKQAVRDNQHVITNLLTGGVPTRFEKGSGGNTRVCEQRRQIVMKNPQTYRKKLIKLSSKE